MAHRHRRCRRANRVALGNCPSNAIGSPVVAVLEISGVSFSGELNCDPEFDDMEVMLDWKCCSGYFYCGGCRFFRS